MTSDSPIHARESHPNVLFIVTDVCVSVSAEEEEEEEIVAWMYVCHCSRIGVHSAMTRARTSGVWVYVHPHDASIHEPAPCHDVPKLLPELCTTGVYDDVYFQGACNCCDHRDHRRASGVRFSQG